MKNINIGANSFSDKMISNHLNKFIKSDVLSKSNNFSDALKKTKEENEEKNNSQESSDLHIKKLVEKMKGSITTDSNTDIEELGSHSVEQSLFGAVEPLSFNQSLNDNFEVTNENQDFKQKIESLANLKQNHENSGLSKLSEALKNKSNESSSKIKLDESFKIENQDQKVNLKSGQELFDLKAKDSREAPGLSVGDIQSKNNLKLQKALRSKNIDNKSKLGALKATQIYEKQQPAESNKLESKNLSLEGASSNTSKLRAVKPVTSTKVGSDTLNNNLMFQSPTEVEQPGMENVGKKEFSNLLDMQTKFKAEGVDDIIQNAQLLANKGGGELKLLLNPKGLGSVQLKVLMEDNQLKVQMSTETKEAQEVIESSLGDLKKALAENNLDIESISVDSFNELNDLLEKEEEYSQNEFAKDFLSEFKQQNNSWRQGLLGFPAVRDRASQILEQPEVTNSTKVKSNRKLDLVA